MIALQMWRDVVPSIYAKHVTKPRRGKMYLQTRMNPNRTVRLADTVESHVDRSASQKGIFHVKVVCLVWVQLSPSLGGLFQTT